MEKLFKLKANGTTVKTEVMAGLTSFLTMVYILVVNPSILAESGMDWGAVFSATALSAGIATLVMGLLANLPFALAPGMGLNAFLTYTVVFGMGYTWEYALAAVLVEGILFILLTICNLREAIVNSIPENLKKAIAVGIGLFIAFIGMQNAGIISGNPSTLVELHMFQTPAGSFSPLVAILGLIVTSALIVLKVPANLLIGIILTTFIGAPFGVTDFADHLSWAPPSLGPTIGGAFRGLAEVSGGSFIDFVVVLFTFLFVDMFDTVGTLIGCAIKGGMIDEKGTIPNCKQALFADAIGTTVGAILGTSTVTTFVESSSGIIAGGRTGLTACVTAALFFLSLFLSPLFCTVPNAATAPILIIIGLYMIEPIKDIDLSQDMSEAVPAFLTIIFMPLAYSIADGIMFGVITYVILKLVKGDFKKALNVPILVVFVLFVAKLILDNVAG